MSIAAVEQWFIDTLKGVFGATVKAVESLPTDWDEDTFLRVLRQAPGVYVVFNGGQRDDDDSDTGSLVITAEWAVMAATAHASGELARRRGDGRQIGAYEILERAARALEGAQLPAALGGGQITVGRAENLFSGTVEKQGGAIYGLGLTVPMVLAPDDAAAALDAFETWDNRIDTDPDNGHDEAEDVVALEQS